MTKGVWISSGIFIVLLAVVLVFALKPSSNKQPELKIRGWHTGTASIDKPEQDGPVDRIVIKFKGRAITAKRDPKNKKIWHMNKPANARADNYKIRGVLKLFKDNIESYFSSKLAKGDLQAFGFDADDVIHVTLYKGSIKFVDLEIGATQKKKQGDETTSDTWVRIAGQNRAFRILGKDMHRPFGKDLDRFRDRKVFTFEANDITGVEITNPGAKDERDRHIVLKSELKPQAKKAKKSAKSTKKPERIWHIAIPAGYRAGDVGSYLARVSDLYAQKFIEHLPKKVKFNKHAFRLKVNLDNGRTKTLLISGQYLKEVGTKEYIKVSGYAARGLRKGLSGFRDKHVWTVPRETIQRLEIITDKHRLVLQRNGNKWESLVPKNLVIGENQRDRLLKDITNLTVSDFEQARHPISHLYVRCLLRLDDGRNPELVVGPKNKNDKHYARVTGQKDTLVLSDYMVSKLHNAFKTFSKSQKKKKK